MQRSTIAFRLLVLLSLVLLAKSQVDEEVRAHWISLNYWLRPNSTVEEPELYAQHIVHVQQILVARDQLVTAGFVGPNAEGLFAMIKNATAEEVTEFVHGDPLYINNIIQFWNQKPYAAIYIDGLPPQD